MFYRNTIIQLLIKYPPNEELGYALENLVNRPPFVNGVYQGEIDYKIAATNLVKEYEYKQEFLEELKFLLDIVDKKYA